MRREGRGLGTTNFHRPVLSVLISASLSKTLLFSCFSLLSVSERAGAFSFSCPRRFFLQVNKRLHHVLQSPLAGTAPFPTTIRAVSGCIHPMSNTADAPKIRSAR